jgi:hypothetical protein
MEKPTIGEITRTKYNAFFRKASPSTRKSTSSFASPGRGSPKRFFRG